MNKNIIFLFLCVALLCLTSLTHQKHIRIRRQGLMFPDNPELLGAEKPNGNKPNNNRPNGNRPNNNKPNENRPNTNRPNGNGGTGPNNQQPTTTASTPTAVTPEPQCMLTCLKTPEYNPVCGSNRVDYNNPSLLNCARTCGIRNLTMLRTGRCPPPTQA